MMTAISQAGLGQHKEAWRNRMKLRISIAALLLTCFAAPLAIAQSKVDVQPNPMRRGSVTS
jgi:hypothetical protein